jgi:hypothetical protein
MTDWNIQSRAHACTACEKQFADKEVYHTLLFDEKADFRRSDICQDCWARQYSEGGKERKGFVSYWHGVYHAPAPPSDPILKETAETLLRKLIEKNDPQYIPAGYILAVMLERKRLLKVKEQVVKEGKRVFIYEHPASGDIFTIADPALQLNQLEEVQRAVAHLLEHGFEAAPLAPAPDQGAPAEGTADAGSAEAEAISTTVTPA